MSNFVVTSSLRPNRQTLGTVLRRAMPILGPGLAIGAAWVSAGERTPMALVDVALLLAVVTVSVALVSWGSGLTTSLAAGLALDYFHTQPTHSLRITSSADVIAVFLLGALGVAVSTASALRVRSLARAHHDDVADGARSVLDAARSVPTVASEMWLDSVRASSHRLSLVECQLELGANDSTLPHIVRHRGGIDAGSDVFVLPEGGALMAFADPRRGHVRLAPRMGLGAVDLDRRVVTAFVDQLDLAMWADRAGIG
jgi:hypothetical protein